MPTLLAEVPGTPRAFAQDGARIAWWAGSVGREEPSAVSIQDLRTGKRTRVGAAGDDLLTTLLGVRAGGTARALD